MTDNRTTERVDHSPRVREAIDELMREKDATDNRTTELRKKLTERGVEYEPTRFSTLQTTFTANGIEWIVTERESTGELFLEPRHGLTPEQAIAATLGTPISADLRTALDFMRIWITDDAHLGESAISYEFEKAEGLRKLDAIEQAIVATLGNTTCEYVIEDNMNETEGMGDVWFRCTNCDMCFDYADDWLLKMPYCPHCGARVKARNE